jgi:hypothetical protein
MKRLSRWLLFIIVLRVTPVLAQAPAQLVAAPNIPPGRIFAPHTPAGMLIIGPDVWVGDGAQGLRHYVPVDPNNIDPINTGNLMFDIATDWSMGGGTACVPWCSVGQIAQDGNFRSYLAVYDHAKGQPGNFGGPGIWRVDFQAAFGNFSPFEGLTEVAPGLGLSGDLPTAVALGPDGNLYVGFLKNGNIKRVTNPSQINPTSQNQTVQTVGGNPNGRTSRAMAFLGPDLYIATDQGLAVVKNATSCVNNQNGCGNAVFAPDGFIGSSHVGLTSDGVSRLYFSLNGAGQVFRYTPTTGAVTPVSSGFAFVGGHTNTLTMDNFGNLWVGDDPSDGTFNFSGRLWRIPPTSLAAIP